MMAPRVGKSTDNFQQMVDDLPGVIFACSGEDNVWISRAYTDELGVSAGDGDWKEHVVNKEYVRAFEEWVAAGPSEGSWEHHFDWRHPKTGQILHKVTSAWWSPFFTGDGEPLIVGRVFDREGEPPRRGLLGWIFQRF